MRTALIAILGTPAACWAALGCATLLGVHGPDAVAVAVGWGALWLSVVHLGYAPAFLARRRRAMRGRGARSTRGVWSAAVLGSLLLPLPVYLLADVFQRLHLAPATLTLPMLLMLAIPAPAALWWMTLWPATEREEEILKPIGWRNYALTPMHGVSTQGLSRHTPPLGGPTLF